MDLLRIPMVGGVNLLSDPRNIRDDELVKAGNLVPVRPGVIQTRGAMRPVTSIPGSFASEYLLSAKFGPWVGSPLFFSYHEDPVGGNPASIVALARFLDGTLGADAQVVCNLPAGDTYIRPWVTPFQGRLYFLTAPGTSAAPALVVVAGAPSFTQFSFSGTGNGDIRPRLAVAYRNRMVWAHFGSGYENVLVFSDNFAPGTVGNDVLATNGRNVSLVAAADGDEITGLVQVMLTSTGTPVETGLLVLRRFSSFLLTGEPDQTTGGTNTLAVNRMSVSAGCSSAWTIQNTPYGVLWAGMDDVWLFQSGQLPRPVGTKLRPALRRTPRGMSDKLTASYFDGFYRLSLFGEEQSVVLPSDGVHDLWMLDLRNGAPGEAAAAGWWGPHRYAIPSGTTTVTGGTGITVRDERPGGNDVLYGVETYNSGSGAGASIVRYDDYAAYDLVDNFTAAFSPDVTIKPDLITKEYDLGDPMLKKLYDGMEANVWASQSGRLLAQGILDGGRSYAETNIDVAAEGYESGVETITSDGVVMPRAPQAVAAFDVARLSGTTVQLRLRGQAGFTIDDTNDTFVVALGSADEFAIGYTFTVAQGFYATLDAFIDAFTLAFAAATGDCTMAHGSNGLVTVTPEAILDNNYMAFITSSNLEHTNATAAQMESTARICTLFGISASSNPMNDSGDPLIPATITADMPTYSYMSPIWELNGLGMRLEVIPRRPS